MSKKIVGTTILVTAVLFGAYGAFAYTSVDGTTNDRNTDTIKGDVDQTQASTCLDLSSDGLRYRANDASTGGEVTELQDFLISVGFLKTQSTGYFGLGTFTAVKQFQRSVGLNPTGYVGTLTKAKIKSQSCALSDTTSSVNTRNGSPQSNTGNPTQGGLLTRPVACTMEARLCPDGTMMPRDYTTCKWLDTKCGGGQGVEPLKQPQTSINSAIKRTVTLEEQQRDYACQKQKTVCDTSTANFNGYACKETTALCERLTAAAAASVQTDPSTTTKIFRAACLYAAPPTGCTYVPGPDYVSGSNCGMVLSCPGGISSTTLNVSDLKVGKIGPGSTGMVCTNVMKFCPDGVTAMPRDASCGWHPELCTGGDRPVGGSQPAPVLQSF